MEHMNKHLNREILARLVDELPDAAEREHLDACAACARELDALRRQTESLARLPDLRPFPGDFDALEARLASEGLIRIGGRPAHAEPAPTPRWMRRVAAVALFAVGAAAGAAATTRWGPAAADPVVAAAPRTAQPADEGAALARVEQAERDYVAALVDYRRLTSSAETDPTALDPRRYAALEQMVRAGQAAVREAPADPFLNGLLASALAEQQAVSRRVRGDRSQQDGWF